ncbi:TonB-dependent receptor [Fulvivirga sp. 29W222]|uniref:TonB-dependent receptor n=1 Tax=Fulvivirga marina TaxID=2494733 RepID=A0A937KFJ3_9BACT|nr:TonB-dependent receptor [Fulvivirga marina]MBL6448248.1 TonB-dependent receptor [Fulvivirga marina]
MSLKYFILAVFSMLSINIFAQSEQKEIRFLDIESGMPIVQATFDYDGENGFSDENGRIIFSYKEGAIMKLSHINYGTWSLTDQQVQAASSKGVDYRRSVTVNLFPVTIIAMKGQSSQPKGELKIEYQDRLEHDAAHILNQTPAFNSIRKGGNYGFDPVFRGFKYDQLNVVVNGAQSVTAACPNRMDPPTSQMAPNMMERIEILKGPHALRFGTGLGATINFIPAQLRFSSQPEFYGRLSGGYESNGNVIRGESQIGSSRKSYNLSLFTSWSQGTDYTTGDDETVQAGFERESFGTNIGVRLSSKQQLRLSAIYNRARDTDFPALAMDLREDNTWMFNARHDILFEGKRLQSWNTTLFGSFVDHLMDNLLKPLDPRMLNAQTLAKTYNYGGRTEAVWALENNKLYAGADVRIEGAEGTRVREYLMGPMAGNIATDNAWQDGRIIKNGFFAEYQINGGSFDYVISGRLEFNTANVNDPTSEFTQVYPETQITQINPNFSIGLLKDFDGKLQTGLWVARAQRSGSLAERYINYFPIGQDPYEMLGNPQLHPETNYQADLNFKWSIKEESVINIDLFAAYLQDYISSTIDTALIPRLPMSPGVRSYVNIDEALKSGFEISWNQKLIAGLVHRLGIAYTYGKDLERNEPLPEIAPLDFRYALYGSYFAGRLRPEVIFRYVAEQSRISEEFGETKTPSFGLLDVKVGYQISKGLSANIGVNNLLNENYYEHLNRSVRGGNSPIFALGRNVFANLNFKF